VLDVATTRRLVGELAPGYRLSTGDVVAAAVSWALADRSGDPTVVVAAEQRRDVDPHLVGCCRAPTPLEIEVGHDPGPDAVLRAVKRATGARDGSPAAVVVHHVEDRLRDDGAAGAVQARDVTHPPVEGTPSAPALPSSAGTEVVGVVVDGCLRLRWAQVEPDLADEVAARLVELAAHAATEGAGDVTTEDFPLADIDADGLASLLTDLDLGDGGPAPTATGQERS
jgi:hypothetical protein